MRLFVSVDLPDALAPTVETVQDELREAAGLSFVDPTQAHITLKFLGEVEETRVPEIEAALAAAVDEADLDPFEAVVAGLGAFPSDEYIRVVWLGVTKGGESLTRLHTAVEARAVDRGFDPETHDFTPHVTIARMQHAGGKSLVQRVLRERRPEVGSVPVEAIYLTESELGSEGPEYTTVAVVPL